MHKIKLCDLFKKDTAEDKENMGVIICRIFWRTKIQYIVRIQCQLYMVIYCVFMMYCNNAKICGKMQEHAHYLLRVIRENEELAYDLYYA